MLVGVELNMAIKKSLYHLVNIAGRWMITVKRFLKGILKHKNNT